MRVIGAMVGLFVLALGIAPALGQGDGSAAGVSFAAVAHAERVGDGPVDMVLIPDVWCGWTVWDAFMDRNADAYTMVAVTLPGMCGTAPPGTPEKIVEVMDDRILTPWLDNAVAAVLDVIEREGLERPVIMGHGMGALIGFRLSVEHPDAISGHVAVDGAPSTLLYTKPLPIEERTDIVRTRLLRTLRSLHDDAWPDHVGSFVASGVRAEERAASIREEAERTDRDAGTRYFLEYYGSDVTDAIRGVYVPTLVIAAAGDIPVARVRGRDRLHAAWYAHLAGMRDLELVFVPECRHFVMDDAPERLDALVHALVARLDD